MKNGKIVFSLKDIYLIFSIILVNFTYNKLINQKIAVAYGLDNKYTYPTLVSMISVLKNSSRHFTLFICLLKKIYLSRKIRIN